MHLRSKGEKAQAISYVGHSHAEVENDSDVEYVPSLENWPELKHGDILYDDNGYRGSTTWVVVGDQDGSRYIENTGHTSAGYSEINAKISCKIEDPMDFYSDVTDEDLYQGVSTIFFDPTSHQSFLQQLTGGRPVHASKTVWFDPADGCIMIDKPSSPDGGDIDCTYLNEDTPAVYLTGAVAIEYPDPDMEKRRIHNRDLHENKASVYFLSLEKGASISLTNFPEAIPQGSHGSGGTLSWVQETGGTVHSVGIEMGHGGDTNIVAFSPHPVPFLTGPFGGVAVWSNGSFGSSGMTEKVPRSEQWMIRIPES